MLTNRFITLFDSRERREVIGHMIAPQTMDPRFKAVLAQRLRVNYDLAETIDEKLSILDSLGSLQADLGELGFMEDHAGELINYYNLFQTMPSRFKALGYAAKFKTNHAARPALTMACLHANEIDINNNIIPAMKDTLSRFYRTFAHVANKAERLSFAITLAELGSKTAIRDLIAWYQPGCKEMGIEPDANLAAHWQVKLDDMARQSLKSFHEYFQIEVERIARFEVETDAVEVEELNTRMLNCRNFCLIARETQFRDMQPHDFFRHMLEKLANNNNLYAMNYLMVRANSSVFPFDGMECVDCIQQVAKWCGKITRTFHNHPCRITATAAFIRFTLADEDDVDNSIKLLEHACALGCARSKSYLPEYYLQRGRVDETLQLLEEVLAQEDAGNHVVTLMMGLDANIKVVWAHAALASFYIDFNFAHFAAVQQHLSCMHILAKLRETENVGLFAKWDAIRQKLRPAADYPDLAAATKEALIVPEAHKRLKRSR